MQRPRGGAAISPATIRALSELVQSGRRLGREADACSATRSGAASSAGRPRMSWWGDEEAAGAQQLRRFDRPPGSHRRVRHAGATNPELFASRLIGERGAEVRPRCCSPQPYECRRGSLARPQRRLQVRGCAPASRQRCSGSGASDVRATDSCVARQLLYPPRGRGAGPGVSAAIVMGGTPAGPKQGPPCGGPWIGHVSETAKRSRCRSFGRWPGGR
jgi:hypothetical protein